MTNQINVIGKLEVLVREHNDDTNLLVVSVVENKELKDQVIVPLSQLGRVVTDFYMRYSDDGVIPEELF